MSSEIKTSEILYSINKINVLGRLILKSTFYNQCQFKPRFKQCEFNNRLGVDKILEIKLLKQNLLVRVV